MRPIELFGLAKAAMVARRLQLLDEGHEIDAAGFEHGAVGEVDLVEFELGELVAHARVRSGQEARADAVGDLAEPEIEARGLDLVGAGSPAPP